MKEIEKRGASSKRSNSSRTRSEKVQPGNPNRLTLRQHVFPRKSIQRFANDKGFVSLVDGIRKMTRPAKPDDKVFCADRAWDQRTETGFMKWAEDNFQTLADEIADGRNDPLSGEQNHAVSMFYAMWYIRSRQRDLPDQFVPMHGAQGETFTKNELEILESKGVMALRADGTMAARHMNGLQIQLKAARIAGNQLKGSQWGIIRCQSGEFIVPDVPIHKLIPITPLACLVEGPTSGNISGENVSSINRDIAFSSQKYFFGRNLNDWRFSTQFRNVVQPV